MREELESVLFEMLLEWIFLSMKVGDLSFVVLERKLLNIGSEIFLPLLNTSVGSIGFNGIGNCDGGLGIFVRSRSISDEPSSVLVSTVSTLSSIFVLFNTRDVFLLVIGSTGFLLMSLRLNP